MLFKVYKPFLFLKSGVGERWRRPVGPIMLEIRSIIYGQGAEEYST
jgi:hypothetical protein